MSQFARMRGLVVAVLVGFLALPAAAQQARDGMTSDEVRAEISEAMAAIATYSEQQREQAVGAIRETLERLDAEIERREQALREDWAELSESARAAKRERLERLRAARNRLGERYGALQAGASSAWDELKSGFANAWDAFLMEWDAADADASSN